MQTIETRRYGAHRIIARTTSGLSAISTMDAALGTMCDKSSCHIEAARKLANKLNWHGTWVGGRTKKGMVFVFLVKGMVGTPDNEHSFFVCKKD